MTTEKGGFMKKCLLIMILGLVLISCGKKGTDQPGSMGIVDTLTSKKSFTSDKKIDEKNCIDDALIRELGENDTVKKVVDDSDISFCNGLRVRIKTFKISNGEFRVYGYAESTSKKMSCLREGSDLKRFPLLGVQGTLVGDKINISLGGHEYSADGKLITSKRFKGKFVKFDVASFSGEMGFFEANQLKCYAQH